MFKGNRFAAEVLFLCLPPRFAGVFNGGVDGGGDVGVPKDR